MFPTGVPGIALLIFRASVAIALAAETYGYRDELPGWLQAGALLVSLAVSVGCLTPIAAALALVLHGAIWSDLGVGAAEATIVSLDAIALALLGPGAFSFDSYRFGRRVVILPPT